MRMIRSWEHRSLAHGVVAERLKAPDLKSGEGLALPWVRIPPAPLTERQASMVDQILTPWLYRRWTFDFPAELYPAIIERLRGTPARAEELVRAVAPDTLTRSIEGGWSIQRHLAHIADLESLLTQRLDAYEQGVAVLPPADMQNEESVNADHDAVPIADVLARLRARREATISRLESYPRDFFARSAWHERLGIQKRVVDSCSFFADHDDHHFALIRSLVKQ